MSETNVEKDESGVAKRSELQPVVMRNMKPNDYAGTWVDKTKTYTLKFKNKQDDEWCYVFLGRKKVWDCNARFARAHFYA